MCYAFEFLAQGLCCSLRSLAGPCLQVLQMVSHRCWERLHPQSHSASCSLCNGVFSPQSCDYEMSPWKQLEYNMCLLAFPHPPSPPTNLLTFWSYVCCARKTLLVALLPHLNLQRGVCAPHSHPPKISLIISSSSVPCSKAKPTKLNWLFLQLPGDPAFLCQIMTSVKWHYKEALSR